MIDQIIHDDSIKKIKAIPECSVHAIISDIPYGICYNEWDILHDNKNTALGGAYNIRFSKLSMIITV